MNFFGNSLKVEGKIMKIMTLQRYKIPRIIRIPKISGFVYKVVSNFQMRAVKKMQPVYGLNKCQRERMIIVSLTTYEARINTVHYTIKTILNQTIKPDKIILWLAKEFETVKLPRSLTELLRYGLEIRYCDDLRSHKKYYYCMKEFPEDIVITFDDDIIYPENQIEKLVITSKKYPGSIVSNEVIKLMFDTDGDLLYQNNEKSVKFGLTPEMMLLPIGCGGVLYPPNSLHKEVFNEENIKKIAFTTDDLWLKAMSVKNGTRAVKTEKWIRTLSCVEGSQYTHLAQVNCIGGGNEKSMKKIFESYPEIKRTLIERKM